MVTIMNWEALTAIGQLVAAVGVIASVLYLAIQVRHKTIRDEDWFEVRAVMRIWLHGAGCRAWWAGYGHKMFAGEFVNFVEAEIAGIEAAQAKS